MIFRRTDKYGYSRYYGGGGPAFVIKIVVTIALMVALVIGAAAFVMQKYMVYTENGGHLELPWEKKASQPDQSGEDPGGLEGLIVTGEESAEASASAEQSAPEEQSAEASASAQQSAPAEQSAEASASAEKSAQAEQSAETSASAEKSAQAEQSAETSASAQQSAESSAELREPQPSWWDRLVSWFRSLFQTGANAAPDSSAPGADRTGKDPADGSQEARLPQTEDDKSDQSGGQTAEQSRTASRESLSGGLLLQHVSIGDVKANYAEGDIKNKKGNGIMLFMKESGGKLNFVSGQSLAEELGVNGESGTGSKVKEVISQLKSKDYYTLAYLNCFQDQKGGARSELGLYDEDNSTWYDGEDRAWVNPANEDYQDYLIGLIKELEEMGFDEIVLNNACYPLTGKTSNLSRSCYDPDTFQETVGAFYKKVARECKGGKSMISVLTTQEAIQKGYDETSGQSLKDMLQLGGRVWVDAPVKDAQDLDKALEEAGYPENALGVLVSSLNAEESCNQLNPD